MSIKLDQTTFFEEFTIDKDYFDATG
ncbi:hypothetical protein FSEG_02203, partial [Fusobacterium necrophorum D12]